MDRMVTDTHIFDQAEGLAAELQWVSEYVDFRFWHYFAGTDLLERLTYLSKEADAQVLYQQVEPKWQALKACQEILDEHHRSFLEVGKSYVKVPSPPKHEKPSLYGEWGDTQPFDPQERLLVACCLAIELRPQLFDRFFVKNSLYDRAFSEFGGYVPTGQSVFFPTVQTLLFLLAGRDEAARLQAMSLLTPGSSLLQQNILTFTPHPVFPRWENSLVSLSPEKRSEWLLGRPYRPDFSAAFPATRLPTERTVEELVLPESSLKKIQEIEDWITHEEAILHQWGMARKFRPGIRVLFHGPPGTGKTMAAGIMGIRTGREVYRVDLSQIISKYIGETEKNLAQVFQQAEHKNWILFFDEADALFGKRTDIKNAHDRYANQEVSYLLQRIEQFSGVVILATNFRGNLDKAFTRRFEAIVSFPMPDAAQRLRLWKQSFPEAPEGASGGPRCEPALLEHLPNIAQRYELSGGSIMNVVRYATLGAVRAQAGVVQLEDVMEGIKEEFEKEGKGLRGDRL